MSPVISREKDFCADMKIFFYYALLIGFAQSEKGKFPKKVTIQDIDETRHIEHVNDNKKKRPKEVIHKIQIDANDQKHHNRAVLARKKLLRRLQQNALSKRNPKLRLKRAHKSRRDRRKAKRHSKHNRSGNPTKTADDRNTKGKRNTEHIRNIPRHTKNTGSKRKNTPSDQRGQFGRIRRVFSDTDHRFGKRRSMFGNSGNSPSSNRRVKVNVSNPCFGTRLGSINKSWKPACNPQIRSR